MKKLFLAGAIALFGAVNAQEVATPGFVQGDMFITGSVGYQSEGQGDFKNSGFNLSPSLGYFVNPNVAIGARLGFNSNTEDNGVDDFTASTVRAGVFGRYYWTPASRFSVFADLDLHYASYSQDNPAGGDDLKASGFGIGLAPGVNYFISDNFALEATWGILGYETTKADYDGAEAVNNFNIGLGLDNLGLGLVYRF